MVEHPPSTRGHSRVDVVLVASLSWISVGKAITDCFPCSWRLPQPLTLIQSFQCPPFSTQLLVADAIMEELREAKRFCVVCGGSNHHCRAVVPVTCCNVREVSATSRRAHGCRAFVAVQLKEGAFVSAVRGDAHAACPQGDLVESSVSCCWRLAVP